LERVRCEVISKTENIQVSFDKNTKHFLLFLLFLYFSIQFSFQSST
jgi:hypothetical protein